jgi:crotonobetainyl-CoA:carnitine CoA-transferase CaiB-like acyl-CoA transferase
LLQGRTLAGLRILEVVMRGFVLSAGTVLAEWGADVIRIEHSVADGDSTFDPEHGERGLGLDLTRPEGKDVLYDLVAGSEVFLTSLPLLDRHRFGIHVDDIRTANPHIVYALGCGLDPRALAEMIAPRAVRPPARIEEILMNLGMGWDRIIALKAAGVIT